ncbi:MAG: tripartite tricarboxylate transporter substrate binding protein [Hyphomicrobiales bacterium]|nr:tripartite tricarboxylate transporter substrate binding protein [Hyphomicrobiales bacterium]
MLCDRLSRITAAAAAKLMAMPAHAQSDYPSRPVRIIVSAPAGGGVDLVARFMAERLGKALKQTFIVENRAGASGNAGTEAVAAAEPNGYTLLATQPGPLTTNAALYRKVAFDPDAFEPLAIVTSIPNALAVRASLPVTSVAELVAYAKANPGKLNYSSPGNGSVPHLTGAWFGIRTGTALMHVPHRGTAPAVSDLVAGHIDMLFFQVDSVRQHHEAGKVRILAATSARRIASLPEIPTLIELGYAGFEASSWNALAAPPNTPPAVTALLNRTINEILTAPDVIAHFRSLSMEPVGGSQAQVRAFLKAETARWGEVIRTARISVQ